MLTGTIHVGDRDWKVSEEMRAGPQSQLFVLDATDSATSRMHVRTPPGATVTKLDEVALLAADPQIRWFADGTGARWETRLVLHSDSNGVDSWKVKFISERSQVVEGPYSFEDGLGRRTDEELGRLLRESE
jgi:hypothetical protein